MIYLDHAATSFPKPPAVLAAVERWFRELGVSAERGDSGRCAEVGGKVRAARAALGRMTGVPADRVAFTSGATESINLFLRAWLRTRDTVLTTAFEHSSVVRPLLALQAERDLHLEILPPDARGGLDLDAAVAALAALQPRLLVFTHASNVTGAVMPAAALCAAARERGVAVLLDASQSAGLLDLDVGATAVALSAHKGLLAPPGLGALCVQPGLELAPQKQGGTGSSRALAEHPRQWPQAFEAGTPNTPAILGLTAALQCLADDPPARRCQRGLELLALFQHELGDAARWLPAPGPRVPVASFVHAELDPAEIGALFDAAGVHVRTGFHCAPWLHDHLGTGAAGTVRISPGADLSADEVRRAARVLRG